MIVAITGGTGFIGKILLQRHLERGDVVRLLSRNLNNRKGLSDKVIPYSFDLVNCKTEEIVPFTDGVDVLYHCAGQIANINQMYALHITGTQKLINAAAKRIGHWVQLSSVGAYGSKRDGIVTETTPLNPYGTYEVTKTKSDELLVEAASKGAFTYSILRPSIVFGPDMKSNSLYKMISVINSGFFFFIGRPGASANYIYIDNVVDALIRCGTMLAARGKVFNLSDHLTIETFVRNISEALGKKIPTMRLPEGPVRLCTRIFENIIHFPLSTRRIDALTDRVEYSIEHIRNELQYKHIVKMDAGIKELVIKWKESH